MVEETKEPRVEEVNNHITPAPEEPSLPPDIEFPKISDSASATLFPDLRSRDSLVNILSFLELQDLVAMVKLNKFAYHFICNEKNREQILSWDLPKEEESRINNYILSMLNQSEEIEPTKE